MITDSQSHGFWKTLPGMLTAAAAVITAVGGVIALLLQMGVIGGGDPQKQPPPQVRSSLSGTGPATSAASTSESVSGAKPWSKAKAIFTVKDSPPIEVRAETVRYCISAGAGIHVNDTTNIAFEKITNIEVKGSDGYLTPNGKATVIVSLVNGQSMEGTISSGCDFFGFDELGLRHALYPERLKNIKFIRE